MKQSDYEVKKKRVFMISGILFTLIVGLWAYYRSVVPIATPQASGGFVERLFEESGPFIEAINKGQAQGNSNINQ